jgi:hypothetical protein
MGKKTNIAKASLATAFLAAGGVAASQASAADPTAVEAVVASYFGPMGLQDNFVQYVKVQTGFDSFAKFSKAMPADFSRVVVTFSDLNKIAPPPGFGGGEIS